MNPANPQTSTRAEWALIGALTLIAALIRLAGFGRLGIDHFDEGIYASTGTWSLLPGGLGAIDPGLIPYAPPGYPILVGLSYGLLGATDRAAIAVSIVAGIAAVPVVGWLARRTFGPGVGVAASGFAAGSMIHVTFSRMALTDSTFLLAWLLAMVGGVRFLDRPGPWRAVALGLAVGVAQLVKYNGWLAGAVVAATALLGPVVSAEPHSGSRLTRTFGWGALAVLVAGLVTWPWFRFVESHGGYAALLAHQRSYLGGPRSWPSNWLIQVRQLAALGSGTATILGPILGLLGSVGLAALAKRRLWGPILGCVGLIVVAFGFFRASTTWWIGLSLVIFLVRDGSPGVRLVGVWWASLSILTPMYHPYLRLWLPLEASGWFVGGVVIASTLRAADAGSFRPYRSRIIAVGLAVIAGWVVPGMIAPKPKPLPSGPGEPRDSLRAASSRIVALVPPEVHAIRLLGRPSMLFYVSPLLGRRGIASGRVADAGSLLAPDGEGWAIVDGVLLRQEGDPDAVRRRLLDRWAIVAEEPTTLSNATLLDVDPASAVGDLSARAATILLLKPRR